MIRLCPATLYFVVPVTASLCSLYSVDACLASGSASHASHCSLQHCFLWLEQTFSGCKLEWPHLCVCRWNICPADYFLFLFPLSCIVGKGFRTICLRCSHILYKQSLLLDTFLFQFLVLKAPSWPFFFLPEGTKLEWTYLQNWKKIPVKEAHTRWWSQKAKSLVYKT